MRIDVLTLFPELFHGPLGTSILKRAAIPPDQRTPGNSAGDATNGDASAQPAPVSYHITDIRDHTTDKHQKVDRPPFGGGPGMVIQCQPVWDAVMAVEAVEPDVPATRIVMSPQGRVLSQALAEELSQKPRLLILAGHYEGFDERVIEALNPLSISIGNYVLTGGELPALVLIDAVVRLLPGVLGNEESPLRESFSTSNGGQLDHPHYTRPRVWQGREVPEVLLSGDHAAIEAWRKEQSRRRSE